MSKKNAVVIKINDTNEEYTLDFNRDSVIFTINQGFDETQVENKMLEMLPILFYGAFRKNHKSVARSKTDDILFNYIPDEVKIPMFTRLVELYKQPTNELLGLHDDEESEQDSKNVRATVEF